MKRFLSFLLIFTMIFIFTACNNNNSSSPVVDLEYYAKLGKIPEVDYTLGEDINKIKSDFEKIENQEQPEDSKDDHVHEFYYSITETEVGTCIDDGRTQYYFSDGQEEKGVAFMVTYDTAFGFNNGTVSVDVTDALKGLEYTELSSYDDLDFFIGWLSNVSAIKYTFKNRVVLFIFEDNGLCATAIYDTDNWEF